MVKKDETDYAAAYRQYCTYGRGRTLKKFCEDGKRPLLPKVA